MDPETIVMSVVAEAAPEATEEEEEGEPPSNGAAERGL